MGIAVTIIEGYKVLWSNANIDGYIGMYAYILSGSGNETMTIQANTDHVDGLKPMKYYKIILNA